MPIFGSRGQAPAQTCWSAKSGRISDSVVVGHDGHRGWLYYVAADKRVRGIGIGKRMMQVAKEWLRERRVGKVQLLVRETNTNVVGFYEHLGFEAAPRVIMGKWLGRTVKDS